MTCALILLFLAPADPIDTPQAAVERFVAAIRKADLVGASEQLGENGRKMLDERLSRSTRAVGLDPATATPREIVAEFQKRFATEQAKQMLSACAAKVQSVQENGDKATAKVQAVFAGKQDTVTVVFTRIRGRWHLDGIDASKARSGSNETAAIATLRNITSAQAQFQACAKADANQNGTGEYGMFGELSGGVEVRGGNKLNPPVLSGAFRKVEKGVVTRSGYHYRIYLCDAKGGAIGEETGTKGVDAAKAETTWCAYAWPVEYGKTGKRSFFVNQFGDILALDHKGFSGKTGPTADAAFKMDAVKGRIIGTTAIGAVGNDGRQWKRVG